MTSQVYFSHLLTNIIWATLALCAKYNLPFAKKLYLKNSLNFVLCSLCWNFLALTSYLKLPWSVLSPLNQTSINKWNNRKHSLALYRFVFLNLNFHGLLDALWTVSSRKCHRKKFRPEKGYLEPKIESTLKTHSKISSINHRTLYVTVQIIHLSWT